MKNIDTGIDWQRYLYKLILKCASKPSNIFETELKCFCTEKRNKK